MSEVELASSNSAVGMYPGLDRNTLAQIPIESLYKRIELNMQKTKSFFDIRLSQALKQSEGDLRASVKTSEEPVSGAIPFEIIRARFLK